MNDDNERWNLDQRLLNMPPAYRVSKSTCYEPGSEAVFGPDGRRFFPELPGGGGPAHNLSLMLSHAFRLGYHAAIQDAPRGAADIVSERIRQIEEKRHSIESDLAYVDFELARAAMAYLHSFVLGSLASLCWPWREKPFNPSGGLDDLVKAGALIAAEIDRLRAKEAILTGKGILQP